jgi:uncharacterized protein YbaP (TraB family)
MRLFDSLPSFRAGRFLTSVGVATALVSGVAAQAPAKTFMWTVTAPGAPPSYLMGSLHVLTPDYYPLSKHIEEAFAESRVLITEADIDEVAKPATMMAMAGKALLADDRTLDQVIDRNLYSAVVQQANKVGLPEAAIQRMKPWVVALALTGPALQAQGFKAEYGVDRHFFERAKKAGYERRALETVAFQFDRLDQMTAAEQEALLRSTLEDLDTQSSNVKTMAEAWATGDVELLERLLLKTMKSSPELYNRMLVDRNASWVSAVDTCVRQKESCFVVVGAAHLVGPDSLVAMLQKKGYRVEQR